MSAEPNPLVAADGERWPDPGPGWRQALLRRHDTVARSLARVHLSGTIALYDALGRAANLAGLHGPSPSQVARLYDWLPRRDVGRVARDISALRAKNRVSIALVLSDRTADLAKRVRWSDEAGRQALAESRRGMVIVACHVGAFFGIRSALHGTGRRVFMMRDSITPDAASRARVLKRAVEGLGAGELIAATLDGPGGTSTHEVQCLGRRITFRRGPFVLARLTGAPIVPVACAWTAGRHIEVRVAAPIARPTRQDLDAAGFEDEMASRTARWFDEYLRAEPQEMWPDTLRHYLAAPPASGTDAP